MNVYQRGENEDLLLAQWHARMQLCGDLKRVYAKPPTLSEFYLTVAPPNVLLYEVDETGLWFAAWMEPCFAGGFLSTWVAPWRRHSVEAYECFLKAVDAFAEQRPVLLGVTKQIDLLPIHKKMGYSELCKIDGFFGGETAYLLQVNVEVIRERIRRHKRWRTDEWNPEWLQHEHLQSGQRAGRHAGAAPGLPHGRDRARAAL